MQQNFAVVGPTGPKSDSGKRRASLNALKHGIFAEVLIQGGKFHGQIDNLDAMVAHLRRAIPPRNALTSILIDQLAITFIRQAQLYALDSELAPIFFKRLKEHTHDASTSIITASIERADEIAFIQRSPSLEVLIKYEAALDRKADRILKQIEKAQLMGAEQPEGSSPESGADH